MTLLLLVLSISSLYLLVFWIKYRFSFFKKSLNFEGEIIFTFIDMKVSHRSFFEKNILQNKEVILSPVNKRFFISLKDHKKIWSLSPHKLSQVGNTLYLKVTVKPLLFGGYSLAVINEITKVDNYPIIRK